MPSRPRSTDPAAAVESALFAELSDRRSEVETIDRRLTEDVDRLVEHIAAGGKRLRPQFLCWGWLAAQQEATESGTVPDGVIKAAAALELIQACALIHDDVIDHSDTRRGRPSVHRSIQKLHAGNGWSGDPEHYGISAALLIGDLALAWADDLFSDGMAALGSPAGARGAWRSMRTEVLAGQLLDLRVTADQSDDPAAAAADAMAVNRWKTAAYTVERPLHLGAALAGATDDTVAALRGFGTSVGLAFQLRDDLLGVFGDPAVTGKPAGGDLIEGKKTVLLAMTRSSLRAEPELLAELDAGVGTPLGPDGVDRLTDLITTTGAAEVIESRISELFGEGMAALTAQGPDGRPLVESRAVENLRRLALAATARDR